ncbi:DUF2764 family protein [bacterium]|nr:MAG: DUF2764 family protein [bacterium]
MAGYYPYLISTLPMLHFGMKPSFSGERFLELCRQFIPSADIEALKKAAISGEYIDAKIHPTLKKWQEFDTGLRNELVKIRCLHKHVASEKYLRAEGYVPAYITHLASTVHRTPDILEAEKLLGQGRWYFLDALSFGHYFDLDFLLIYALKLFILERWDRAITADKEAVLEEALAKS